MKKYILRRVIPEDECPGTCCKLTGAFPAFGTTRCVYFQNDIVGRKCGGCPFFKPDGSVDQIKLIQLSTQDKKKFQFTCNRWPCPDTIPELNKPYDSDFGQDFGDICPCFRWEVIDDG